MTKTIEAIIPYIKIENKLKEIPIYVIGYNKIE